MWPLTSLLLNTGFSSKVKLSDIDTIEIKDVSLLPEPYRRHIKVYWGIKFFNGLKIFKLRKGDAVHIKTKSGQIFIITPEDDQKLVNALKKGLDQLSKSLFIPTTI